MRIGVDLMGSDSPPSVVFAAVLRILHENTSIAHVTLFAPSAVLDSLDHSEERLVFQPAEEEITMEDAPLAAVRSKKDSSLVQGVQALSEGAIDAFVSAGNTGALVASATFALPNICRPALLATLPKKDGVLAVIDVGGHLTAKAEHLVQYAYLGAAFQKCVNGISHPSVGLLNIGAESKKGTAEVREAHQLLRGHSAFHFHGNIEGQGVLQSPIDVLVTDGFTGNVFLKTAEGVSAFVFDTLMEELGTKTLQGMQHKFHYTEYPGGMLCGIEGLVIKCHGGAKEEGIASSIRGAVRLLEIEAVQKIKKELESWQG